MLHFLEAPGTGWKTRKACPAFPESTARQAGCTSINGVMQVKEQAQGTLSGGLAWPPGRAVVLGQLTGPTEMTRAEVSSYRWRTFQAQSTEWELWGRSSGSPAPLRCTRTKGHGGGPSGLWEGTWATGKGRPGGEAAAELATRVRWLSTHEALRAAIRLRKLRHPSALGAVLALLTEVHRGEVIIKP